MRLIFYIRFACQVFLYLIYGTINCKFKPLINVWSMNSSTGRGLVVNALSKLCWMISKEDDSYKKQQVMCQFFIYSRDITTEGDYYCRSYGLWFCDGGRYPRDILWYMDLKGMLFVLILVSYRAY